MRTDPDCQQNIADQTDAARAAFTLAWECILADAAGELPDYRERPHTEADGQAAIDSNSAKEKS
jgi:hypothetical protein